MNRFTRNLLRLVNQLLTRLANVFAFESRGRQRQSNCGARGYRNGADRKRILAQRLTKPCAGCRYTVFRFRAEIT